MKYIFIYIYIYIYINIFRTHDTIKEEEPTAQNPPIHSVVMIVINIYIYICMYIYIETNGKKMESLTSKDKQGFN